MSHVIVYLTGDAVSFLHSCEVYLIILSGGKAQILLCKLSVLACHLITQGSERSYGSFKVRNSFIYDNCHSNSGCGKHYLLRIKFVDIQQYNSRRCDQPPFFLPQSVI